MKNVILQFFGAIGEIENVSTVAAGEVSKSLQKHMTTVTFRYAFMKSKQMQTASNQTATLQAIFQMVDDPNKPGTAEDNIK